MKIQFTATQKSYLKEIQKKLSSELALGQFKKAPPSGIEEFWHFLEDSELQLIHKDIQNETAVGDVEYSFALYILNNKVPKALTTLLRDRYGMPSSGLDYDTFIKDFNLGGFLTSNGSLVAISKYAVLDPGWFISLLQYVWYKYIHSSGRADFVNNNVIVPIKGNTTSIAVLGDWGTGAWKDGSEALSPAELVIQGIVDLQPDYIIHLGDVYYAGTGNEERDKFIDLLPDAYKDRLFTMNSNHEMYDGANGYFDTALANPLFKNSQDGTSYFALEAEDWVIVGLDSAYFDESPLYMKGAIAYEKVPKGKKQINKQVDFLSSYAKSGKQLILMTHHNGISFDGSMVNQLLWDQVTKALGQKTPDIWYWGHIHNGVVYNDTCGVSQVYKNESVNGKTPKFRCSGHAAIPFGKASGLLNEEGTKIDSQIDYLAHTPMDAPNPTLTQELRTLNGFNMLNFSPSGLEEVYYEVSNNYKGAQQVWPPKKK